MNGIRKTKSETTVLLSNVWGTKNVTKLCHGSHGWTAYWNSDTSVGWFGSILRLLQLALAFPGEMWSQNCHACQLWVAFANLSFWVLFSEKPMSISIKRRLGLFTKLTISGLWAIPSLGKNRKIRVKSNQSHILYRSKQTMCLCWEIVKQDILVWVAVWKKFVISNQNDRILYLKHF